ncbi:MAG: SDR family oxidoreductase [Rhodobacterales bacterium]|jgi:3-oxoacyl-[acyl-carrier protein] reductase|tara:strand:+ start:6698 stop:7477 length:780 start_codon:yes stop_codon:yes gene_type:complete
MDLGISGKRALVCASSKGLGLGCAEALASAGVNLIMNARSEMDLTYSANRIIDRYGVEVETVVADITSEDQRAKILDRVENIDILVTNAGGPPPGTWEDWNKEDFVLALEANMLTPISLMKHYLPGMMERGWGRVVNITSQSVKAPIATLGLSNSARAGLTGYVAGTSRQVAHSGVTINNLLPGSHATDRIKNLLNSSSQKQGVSVEDLRKELEASIPAKRLGTHTEFGEVCAFLCSIHAGFIVGQNILVDGGAVNATL